MRHLLSIACLLAWTPLPLVNSAKAQEKAKLGAWSEKAAAAWWKANSDPSSWIGAVDGMLPTLREATERSGLDPMSSNPHWTGWMLHARWLSLWPENDALLESFIALGQNRKIRDSFLATLAPGDDEKKAVTILCRISEKHPEAFARFPQLAMAFAVVFDQPVPEGWPHAFVRKDQLPIGHPDPVDRFSFMVKSQEEGRLMTDLSRMSTRDLVFLVDSPLDLNQLRYAQQIKIRNAGKLDDLYQAIKYDTGRIQRKQYIWPGKTYNLPDIGKQGGVCMDQAFFVSQSGKALGIPTILFIGQGASGEHAWVGYVDGNGSWELDVARYREQNYPIGQAYHPQTWTRITESELAALGNKSELRALRRGHLLLQWAALNQGEKESYPAILRNARRAMPDDPRPWTLEGDWLEESEADPKEQLKFWADWVSHYGGNKDLKVKGQMRMIAIMEESGREADAERLRAEIMSGTRNQRFDLGIAIAAEPVFRKLRKSDYEGAEKSFEAAMRRFGGKAAGGFLFYNLIEPYVMTCLQENQNAMAQNALQHLDKGFEAKAGSILDTDMKALRGRAGAK